MAHFAELELKTDPSGFTTEEKYIVKRVVVVGNDIPAANGTIEQHDMHEDGEFHCKKLFGGGIWKQTSYNHNFRKRYAAKGSIYDPVNDVFVRQKPYSNWVWSDAKNNWVAPVADPSVNADEYNAVWDQENNRWGGVNGDVSVYWDPDTSSWKNA